MGVALQDLTAGLWWVSLPRGPERGGGEAGIERGKRYGILIVLGRSPFLDAQVVWLDSLGHPKRVAEFCQPWQMECLEVEGRLPAGPMRVVDISQIDIAALQKQVTDAAMTAGLGCMTPPVVAPLEPMHDTAIHGGQWRIRDCVSLAVAIADNFPPLNDLEQTNLRQQRILAACRDDKSKVACTSQEEDFVNAWRANFRKAVAEPSPSRAWWQVLLKEIAASDLPYVAGPAADLRALRIENAIRRNDLTGLDAAEVEFTRKWKSAYREKKFPKSDSPVPPYHELKFDPSNPQPIGEQGTIAKWMDVVETAWGIIANAGGGDWEKETKDWREAAGKWRDEYFKTLRPLIRKGEQKGVKLTKQELWQVEETEKAARAAGHIPLVDPERDELPPHWSRMRDEANAKNEKLEKMKERVAAELDAEDRLTEDEYETVVRTMQEIADKQSVLIGGGKTEFMRIFKEKMRGITKCVNEPQYSGERVSVPLAEVEKRFGVKLDDDKTWRKQLAYEDIEIEGKSKGRYIVGSFDDRKRFWQLDAETMEWICTSEGKLFDTSKTFARKYEAKAAINTCKKPPFMVQQ